VGAEQGRAQRWHDTDHGVAQSKPLRPNRFRIPRKVELGWVSACWCCCELCDPDWNPDRCNPYWSAATAER
jgi:hypothetical protein